MESIYLLKIEYGTAGVAIHSSSRPGEDFLEPRF